MDLLFLVCLRGYAMKTLNCQTISLESSDTPDTAKARVQDDDPALSKDGHTGGRVSVYDNVEAKIQDMEGIEDD